MHLVRDTLGHASLVTTSPWLHARRGDSPALYLPSGQGATGPQKQLSGG